MKTIIASILLLTSLQIAVLSQNRICGWETEKITSVTIELTSQDRPNALITFDNQKDMDKILNFLKKVDFRELDDSNIDSLNMNDGLEYRIIFKGQRDQVYLKKHSASIGKTSFVINPEVIDRFEALIEGLGK